VANYYKITKRVQFLEVNQLPPRHVRDTGMLTKFAVQYHRLVEKLFIFYEMLNYFVGNYNSIS